MDNKPARDGFEGRLPAMAPLANPYVPFQLEDPPKYEPGKALIRGTLFPGLDLPYLGMVNKKELPLTPLTELQTVGFVIQELALYLDTHRDDKEAYEVFRNFQEMYKKGVAEYEKKNGPLTLMSDMGDHYSWLHDPWPWEFAANREV